MRHEAYSNDHHHTIYLFGQKGEIGIQVWIYLYDIPKGENEYAENVSSLKERKNNFFLKGKVKFSPSFLKPRCEGEFRSHQAFGTTDFGQRRRIVHQFEGAKRNIIVVYSMSSIAFQESLLFAHAAENMTLADTKMDFEATPS